MLVSVQVTIWTPIGTRLTRVRAFIKSTVFDITVEHSRRSKDAICKRHSKMIQNALKNWSCDFFVHVFNGRRTSSSIDQTFFHPYKKKMIIVITTNKKS